MSNVKTQMSKLKIAIFQDRLIKLGGAERVLDGFIKLFPQAPVYTTIYNVRGTAGHYAKKKIRTSFLQKIPFSAQLERYLTPLFPKAVESFDFSKFHFVISNTYSFGKGVITKKPTLHLCYCHTPTRFLWHQHKEAMRKAGWTKFFFYLFLPYLRSWDKKASQRPDFLVANSINIQNRIRKYYQREADEIIFPAISNLPYLKNLKSIKRQNFYLIISRLEIHKAIDLAVKVFNQNKKQLKIIGRGSELKNLSRLANSNIEFLNEIDDNIKWNYLSRAKALIFPQEEDFGIVACEAQWFGTPVIAYGKGGALETVKNGATGLFFNRQTPASLNETIKKFERKKWNHRAIHQWAKQFKEETFLNKWKNLIKKLKKGV